MNAEKVKSAAYNISKDTHSIQDDIVFNAIEKGYDDARKIENYTGIILTSIRRSLHSLRKKSLIYDLCTPAIYDFKGIDNKIRKVPSARYGIVKKELTLF